ncbi:UNVERIFIED_CONTAM: Retrovirus-related Pol polyprotein from transposon RE2 [Sesamum angustifolium]|uniref:Retrovirus-related Pol polyprotein from transposon RE2 n=1 Tax=Sesamum angustifolium TaxID=2727405 RepID=A0AAW2K1T5_9LAMI
MIEKNNTWELANRPKDKGVIGVKWIYKTKLNADGSIQKHKARLVAKGYSQLPGIDYTVTFAPVARLDTIRALIAIAANKKWKIYQMDVKSAFLHGYIDEEIYVEQPQGFIAKGSEEKVLRLKKALYGLKQAPRAWCSRIDKYFMDRGFQRSLSEPTLYIKSQGNDKLIVSLYVDDLIYTGNNEKMIQYIKEDMMKRFEMSDLGLMHFFLGIEINQEKEGIFICQRKYTETLPKKFKMESCKTVLLLPKSTRKKMDQKKFMSPSQVHYAAAKRILRYLRGTKDFGIRYKSTNDAKLVGYTDSDWVGSVDDMKSTSGYTFSLGSGIFSWASKKQATVAQSSAEAEYIAAAATSNQAIWLRRILEDIGEKQEEPTTIYCDNKSAIAITKNPVQHSRTKHIGIKYHSLREATTRGEIELKYCSTEEQLADIFTKALPRNKFEELRMKIGVCHKHIKGEY